jgi:hypothetical protein
MIIQQVDPETGRSRPTPVAVLPEPVTSAEAGLMDGSPPQAELRVSRRNWMAYPHSRWSFRHMEELGPSSRIGRGEGPARELERAAPGETGLDLSGLEIEGDDGSAWTLDEFLHRTYTDAFLIAHRGKVVHEHYIDGMTPASRHAMFSTTKTFTGLLAMLAIHDGQLGLDDLLIEHVPEFGGTAWEPVTVRHALDMTDGIQFVEDYSDRTSEIMRYGVAMGFSPRSRDWEGPDGIREALCSFTARATEPGEVFLYKSATTDALAWATARATGRRWTESVAERIWQPLGAATDAGISLDSQGLEISSGGMFATAPDLLRFGLMIASGGRNGAGDQVLPEAVVRDLVEGGEPGEGHLGGYTTRAGWSFHRQCWNQYRLRGTLMPMGVHGQRLLVHPGKDLVVMKLGSHPVTGNVFTDEVHQRFYEELLARV